MISFDGYGVMCFRRCKGLWVRNVPAVVNGSAGKSDGDLVSHWALLEGGKRASAQLTFFDSKIVVVSLFDLDEKVRIRK